MFHRVKQNLKILSISRKSDLYHQNKLEARKGYRTLKFSKNSVKKTNKIHVSYKRLNHLNLLTQPNKIKIVKRKITLVDVVDTKNKVQHIIKQKRSLLKNY